MNKNFKAACFKATLFTSALFALCTGSAVAVPMTIDFDNLVHGTIVDNEYIVSYGATISAINRGGGPDMAVAFNTTLSGTRDSDLEGPWSGGNLPVNTNLGNILIIQENNVGTADGIADLPDDEGSRPAGSIFFDFATAIDSFGFDLIDVEGPSEYGANSGYFATFFGGGLELANIGFGELVDPSSSFYDSTIIFGDNNINRIAAFTSTDLGIGLFDRVEINFGGSAGIDNIVYNTVPVPAPSTVVLLLAGLAGISIARRKHR